MLIFHKLKVKGLKKETAKAVSIVFDIPSNLVNDFRFIAGQYVTIQKAFSGNIIRRAYSICSIPGEKELRIVIKAVKNGVFSTFATTVLKEGDFLEVAKPEGKFVLETISDKTKN